MAKQSYAQNTRKREDEWNMVRDYVAESRSLEFSPDEISLFASSRDLQYRGSPVRGILMKGIIRNVSGPDSVRYGMGEGISDAVGSIVRRSLMFKDGSESDDDDFLSCAVCVVSNMSYGDAAYAVGRRMRRSAEERLLSLLDSRLKELGFGEGKNIYTV